MIERRPVPSSVVLTDNREADPLPRVADGVILRRLGTADLAAFQAYRTDTDLGRYQGWTPMPDAQALAFLEEMSHAPLFRPGAWTQVGIADPESLALLGDIGLHLAKDSRQAEIGFTLARHAHGRGLATAAVREAIHLIFELTEAECVLGITDVRNLPSIRLLQRLGMNRIESRHVTFKGEACDEYIYAMSRRSLQEPDS